MLAAVSAKGHQAEERVQEELGEGGGGGEQASRCAGPGRGVAYRPHPSLSL